jgi:[ribosomal protein S18]-alanine N-acetyltransferase
LEVRPLRAAEAATIAAWRYPGRYSTYDVDDSSVLERDVWAVREEGALVGYCCFGAPARVDGAAEEAGVVDVGYGMAPDRVGGGLGHRFVEAILAFATESYSPERLRMYVLDWNERSQRVAAGHGFEVASELTNRDGRFLVLERGVAL